MSEEVTTPNADAAMQEFYQLKQRLLFISLAVTGIAVVSVWWAYSLATALNYLLGACAGLAYFRMLARDVERLGVQKRRLGSGRFAIFVGLIIVATQWQDLHVVPVFLGFLTYKVAIIIDVVQATFVPPSS